MAFKVFIQQVEQYVTVGGNETILDAALAAGINYPCGCQTGNCGACKSALLSGRVDLADYGETALEPNERAAGYILACRAVPQSDCDVAWVDLDEVAAHQRRKVKGRVTGLDSLTHDIVRLRVKPDGGPLAFSPGQYAELTFDGLPPRQYSMANLPSDGELEFHLRLVPGGTVTPFIQNRLKVGDRIGVEGPFGVGYLRERHNGPIVALAGGAGMAPIESIIARAVAIGHPGPIHVYFGVRDERDVYGETAFLARMRRHPNFKFHVVLSEPSGATARRTGFLADIVRADFPKPLNGAKAYLAGPPIMVETCMPVLQAIGVARADCHADAFYTAADRARLSKSS